MFLYSLVLVGGGQENEVEVGRKLRFTSGLTQGKTAALALVQAGLRSGKADEDARPPCSVELAV